MGVLHNTFRIPVLQWSGRATRLFNDVPNAFATRTVMVDRWQGAMGQSGAEIHIYVPGLDLIYVRIVVGFEAFHDMIEVSHMREQLSEPPRRSCRAPAEG